MRTCSIFKLKININSFTNQKDVVNWYIWMNTWWAIHTAEDIKIAKDYLKTLK